MVFHPFLAITAAEMALIPEPSFPVAWMACHFSDSGKLANLPAALPPGSILILDDWIPPKLHDPKPIAAQLAQVAESLGCSQILLDFQKPGNPLASKIVQEAAALPFPVIVSDVYARDAACSVLLPPLPLTVPLEEYLQPWAGRNIWLEMAPDCCTATVTEEGCAISPCENGAPLPYFDDVLACRYGQQIQPNALQFTLQRSKPELESLMQLGHNLGVSGFIGLYQQLKKYYGAEKPPA